MALQEAKLPLEFMWEPYVVGANEAYVFALGFFQAVIEGSGDAQIFLVEKSSHPRVSTGVLFDDVGGGVCGAIVYYYKLQVAICLV